MRSTTGAGRGSGDYTVTWDPEAPVRRLIARFPEEVISVRGPQRPAKARQADRG